MGTAKCDRLDFARRSEEFGGVNAGTVCVGVVVSFSI